MIEALLSDPEKVTLLVALLVLIAMFIRGDVIPGKAHDRILAQQKEGFDRLVAQQKDGYDKRIESAIKSEELWKQIAFKAVNLSEVSASSLEFVTKKTIVERSEG